MVLNCEIDLESFWICFGLLMTSPLFLKKSILIAYFVFNVFVTFQGLMTMPWDVSLWNMSDRITAVLTVMQIIISQGTLKKDTALDTRIHMLQKLHKKDCESSVLNEFGWKKRAHVILIQNSESFSSIYIINQTCLEHRHFGLCAHNCGQTNNYCSLGLGSDLRTQDKVNKFSSLKLPKMVSYSSVFYTFSPASTSNPHHVLLLHIWVLSLAQLGPLCEPV